MTLQISVTVSSGKLSENRLKTLYYYYYFHLCIYIFFTCLPYGSADCQSQLSIVSRLLLELGMGKVGRS